MSVRTVLAKAVAVVAVPAVIGGVCFGLSALGVPVDLIPKPGDEPTAATIPAPQEVVEAVAPAPSLASNAIDAMFDQIDTAWMPQGRRVAAAGLPHPLTCVTPAPGLSVSQTYTTKAGQGAQVTIVSYPAGLGAWMFDQMPGKARNCKPASTSMTVTGSTGIGVESARYTVAWSGNRASIEVVRRGDVLTFTATTNPAPGTAKAVDGVVAAHMGKCVEQKSTVADAYRNTFTAKGKYEPYTTPEKVTRDPATEPTPPAGVDAVSIPAKTYKVPTVERPVERVYPVWPDLPEARPVPVAPEPPKPQVTSLTVQTLVEDTYGPGCGWEWMTSAKSPFDAADADRINTARVTRAQTRLEKDEQRWLADVVDYWSAYAQYRADVISYRKYAERVADVTKAWEAIDALWDTYWAEYDAWEQAKADRDRFIAQKKAARETYDDLMEQCLELAEEPVASDVEKDVEAEEPDIVCPPVRPEILDQKAPKVGKEPSKPKNPRPDA